LGGNDFPALVQGNPNPNNQFQGADQNRGIEKARDQQRMEDDFLDKKINRDDFIVINPRNPKLDDPLGRQPVVDRSIAPPAVPAARLPVKREIADKINQPQAKEKLAFAKKPNTKEVKLGVAPATFEAEQREATAIAESHRQQKLGREAFEILQYGRALERWKQAVKVAPQDSPSYFLLAQAQMATGKYHEAVVSIETGMQLRVDWPTARFDPKDLYGKNQAFYDQHLQALKEALRSNPDNPELLFLVGYQYWFGANVDEAKKHFEKARQRTKQIPAIDSFLELPMIARQ
jgi:tetratricopeptide (TPR) repeat protein